MKTFNFSQLEEKKTCLKSGFSKKTIYFSWQEKEAIKWVKLREDGRNSSTYLVQ